MLLKSFIRDEHGFIISAELILVATLLVIGMIVGLSEVQHSVTQELNDVGDALGSLNQSFYYSGFSAFKTYGGGVKSFSNGSAFWDYGDDCDNNQCSISCQGAIGETPKSARSYQTVPSTCSCDQRP